MRRKLPLITLGVLLLLAAASPARAQSPFDECSTTEAWMPMGNGLPVIAELAEVMNDELYVIRMVADGSYTLSKWDGTVWSDLSTFPDPSGSMADLAAYDGRLYLSGAFASFNGIPNTNGLVRWNGTAWEAVPGNPLNNENPFSYMTGNSSAMAVYKGELIVNGMFTGGSGEKRSGILAWNGSTWRTLAESNPNPAQDDSIYIGSMVEFNGDLYVAGYFSGLGPAVGAPMGGVARWDGASWSRVGAEDMGWGRKLAVLNGELYLLHEYFAPLPDSRELLERWDGANWQPVRVFSGPQRQPFTFSEFGMEVHDGSLYLMIRWATVHISLRWDGTTAHPLASTSGLIHFLINYRNDLIAGGEFPSACGLQVNAIARLCTADECAGISGRVVDAAEGECADLAGKPGLKGRIVELLPGPRYAMTDDDGLYRALVPPGSYTISITPRLYWTQTCPPPPGTHTVQVVRMEDAASGNDFALRAMPDVRDLRLSIVGGIIRRGQVVYYTVACTNVGTVPVPACTIRFQPDGVLEYIGAEPEATRHGSEPEWELSDLAVDETRTIFVRCRVSENTPFDATVCAGVSLDDMMDAAPADNSDSACAPLRYAYDPNDIAVAPAGRGEGGVIDHADSVLTYTVRFQNTGNDTAFRVVVVDTISGSLDLPSLALGASSHPFRLSIGEKGALIWDFQNIMLPDSGATRLGSQGYFKYSVRLKRGLSPNTRIENRAAIYFDYNAPVITNTVLSTVPALAGTEEETSATSSMSIYPNPTRGRITVTGALPIGGEIAVLNLLGERVLLTRYEGGGDATLDLGELPAGHYIISVRTERGEAVRRVTLMH